MKNTNIIFFDEAYQKFLDKLNLLERYRIFCKHNLDHFMAVGRIATILAYEEGLDLSRDLIYSAALLHDIGRVKEIEDGTPHNEASYEIAKDFLDKTDFSLEEREIILSAILNHRKGQGSKFDEIFYRADKLSRNCFTCPARDKCNWPDSKKNLEINY
ncbi:HD domain-containing protein [Peptoniphilus catoniae]|uniref:HD domain-containing protein n=1 Tax=Peptoniphilus catoniae TaxID=1660341 RepID=UPI0010FD81F7|nr:HD domain-containing protein [Peptoniphilus catoniae]